ncbi:MAG: Gfo/Idh/MocA family oxidoreductase [Caulobacterales bacterium]
MSSKIRVGIIGVQPERSWAALAHIPALQELSSDYEITALSTTRQESADAAAKLYGVAKAFDNHQALVSSPDVDLVAVTVKVVHHLELVTAALEAGKHVYCEWPLGNGLAEAEKMTALAKQKGVKAVAGMQARSAPVVSYVRDLVAEGYVGEVLSTSLVGAGGSWGEYVEAANAYNNDIKNGATMLDIPVGHTMDGVCSVLGEIAEISAVTANRRKSSTEVETGRQVPMTGEDQIAFAGTFASGAVFSVHYRGGFDKGTGLLWEINGTRGVLRVTSFLGHMQIFDLAVAGVTGDGEAVQPLTVPDKYFSTSLRAGMALNVAEAYAKLAKDLRTGSSDCPTFADAVTRHKMVDAVRKAAQTGAKQRL